ncbi:MAG: cell envelope integrity protein TolA [Oligoflexia bacterium]|nr:cell envelope integrity protein TolA [Oligoflexia bacterium]
MPPRLRRSAHPAEQGLSFGMRWSFGIHAAILAYVVLKSLVFPGKPIVYTPSLRVDIVGLPDVLKKDLPSLAKVPPPVSGSEAPSKSAPAPKSKSEPAAPDEMVLKPKKADPKAEAQERQKKLKNALARIKALDKISGEPQKQQAPMPGILLKGNVISRGTSLEGNARESSEAGYFDTLRERLRENWMLPVWLARQKLSAQINIFIDTRGQLRGFTIVRSSGNPQFDEAVKKTLTQSQPFPPPPEAIAGTLMSNGVLVGFPL